MILKLRYVIDLTLLIIQEPKLAININMQKRSK